MENRLIDIAAFAFVLLFIVPLVASAVRYALGDRVKGVERRPPPTCRSRSVVHLFSTNCSLEIERAVPRKIEVMKRWSGLGKIESGSISAMPHANGTAIPAADTVIAALPTRFTNLRSVSIPVRSRSMRMPSCDTASIMLFCSAFFGKIACCSGQPS
jgi:hypothetical protein